MSKKNWIKDAIKKPGSLTAAAKRKGMSISQYCKNPPSTKAKRRCNLAKTLKSFKKKKMEDKCKDVVVHMVWKWDLIEYYNYGTS